MVCTATTLVSLPSHAPHGAIAGGQASCSVAVHAVAHGIMESSPSSVPWPRLPLPLQRRVACRWRVLLVLPWRRWLLLMVVMVMWRRRVATASATGCWAERHPQRRRPEPRRHPHPHGGHALWHRHPSSRWQALGNVQLRCWHAARRRRRRPRRRRRQRSPSHSGQGRWWRCPRDYGWHAPLLLLIKWWRHACR